ncbi:MAG TPA: hypothetical protein V6D11_11405 [Waterburya sp.]
MLRLIPKDVQMSAMESVEVSASFWAVAIFFEVTVFWYGAGL